MVIFIAAAIGSAIMSSHVEVVQELTDYLPEDTETRQGVDLMDAEFTTFGTAKVMISNVTYEEAKGIVEQLSDIKALRWSDIKRNEETNTLVIIQKKTKALNAVPIGNTALSWMPPKGNDDFVFHLPAKANVDAALKRIAKKVGIEKNISFHCARHTFGILVQAVTGNIETTKKLMGHKSLKSTAIYADVLTNEKVKAVDNTKKAFRGRKQREENKQIPRTKRTAATNTHPRRITFIQDNK